MSAKTLNPSVQSVHQDLSQLKLRSSVLVSIATKGYLKLNFDNFSLVSEV